jgi:hypothetical protein
VHIGASQVSRRPKLVDLILGPLPADVINATIDTELDLGEVILTRGSQAHAAKSHPKEYAVCLPHVASIVTAPLFVGDDTRNPGKIELIGRVAAINSFMLVAVIMEKIDGYYRVASFYPVSEVKIQNRKEKGTIRIARSN